MKKIIIQILKIQAKLALRRHRAIIIAITGSYGKTSTKEVLGQTLTELLPHGAVRYSKKSFNNEFGVPLTILGFDSPGKSPLGWLKILTLGWFAKLPKVLVLEIGADHPGEIAAWAKMIQPQISIITGISPVHLQHYKTLQDLINEKQALGTYTKDFVILNADDIGTSEMRDKFTAPVITYGFAANGDFRANNATVEFRRDNSFTQDEALTVTSADIISSSQSKGRLQLTNALGNAPLASAVAAFAAINCLQSLPSYVGANASHTDILEALEKAYQPVPGRLRPLAGIKGCLLIDDSYNAAPAAMANGLKLLGNLPQLEGRKIAALGHMAEIGATSEAEHRNIGWQVSTVADYLVAVGEIALGIVEGAKEAGMPVDKIHWCKDSVAAGIFLDRFVAPGDIVYIKGSQSARMEKVTKDLLANPEKAQELIVRQEPEWL